MIRVRTPYSRSKNLAEAYNSEFENCPDGDWLCLIDHDVTFLTPDAIDIMHEYIDAFPEAGLFTCFTNRIHPLALHQLFYGAPSDDFNIKGWAYRARIQAMNKTTATEIKHPISGFLMLVPKNVWREIKFTGEGCLGVDNRFSSDVMKAGKKIYRMDRVVVWHSYRMEDIKDKSHLR